MRTETGQLDVQALRSAIEGTDLDALVDLYADDAEIVSVDRSNTPRRPRVLKGKEAIRRHFADVCSRDMSHHLERVVVSDGAAAFAEACRYADGTNVLCMATVEVGIDGRIARQLDISAWDDAGSTEPQAVPHSAWDD